MARTRSWGIALVAVIGMGCSQTGLNAPVAAPMVGAQSVSQATGRTDTVFPTDVGHTWNYQTDSVYRDDPERHYDGTESAKIDSVRRSGRSTTLQLRVIDDYSNKLRFPTLTLSDEAVTFAGATYWGSGAKEAEEMTFRLLKLPFATGNRWDDGDWAGETRVRETVSVPAGTFDTWKIGAIGTYDHAYTAVGTYWVAPGVGIVKSDLGLPNIDCVAVLLPPGTKATIRKPLPKGFLKPTSKAASARVAR
ncbi:MAG: hypothetical protein H7338_10035 [Candidatus Sericytochromatia bacterium]|nr:hypothetical protein [Candidatus Sericytochromatia bacterium]